MKKIYSLFVIISVFVSSVTLEAQMYDNNSDLSEFQEDVTVNIYPNPSTSNIIYISSNSGKTKTVSVFTVLGNQAIYKVMTNNELDISSLAPGVYIFKVKVGEHMSTQKVIKGY